MAEHEQEQPVEEQSVTGEQAAAQEGAGVEEQAAATAGAIDGSDPTENALARLEEDLVVARDAALRAQADAQNVKRRAEQDVEKARKFALEQFARELLPVVDNLERALGSTAGHDEAVKPIAEGVELTLKSFQDALRKFNIESVDPQGEPFDPNLHQAMSMIENNDVEPNSVIAVMQKGYTLNGRLLRPAMVMVSKLAV